MRESAAEAEELNALLVRLDDVEIATRATRW